MAKNYVIDGKKYKRSIFFLGVADKMRVSYWDIKGNLKTSEFELSDFVNLIDIGKLTELIDSKKSDSDEYKDET